MERQFYRCKSSTLQEFHCSLQLAAMLGRPVYERELLSVIKMHNHSAM